jgi:anti-anti-sigma factor
MNDPPLCSASRIVESGVLVVTINVGEVRTAETAYDLRDEIRSLFDAAGARHLIVDARNLAFMGSVGFLAFLGIRRHLPEGRIVLCNLAEPVRHAFYVCRLIPVNDKEATPFEVTPTLEAAVASFD